MVFRLRVHFLKFWQVASWSSDPKTGLTYNKNNQAI